MAIIKLLAALMSLIVAVAAGLVMAMEMINTHLLHAFLALLVAALFCLIAHVLIRSEFRK